MPPRSIVQDVRSLSGSVICPRCLLKLNRPAPSQRRWISKHYLEKERKAAIDWEKQAQEVKSGKRRSFLSILEERGLIQSVVGERSSLDEILTWRRTGAYVGIDPTAASLHVGNMVTLMPLFWMYAHGFGAFTLLGGSTAKIGDPTGRTTSREVMDNVTRKTNIAEMHMQLKKLWMTGEAYVRARGYKWEWAWKKGLVNNNTWWNKTPFLDVMRDLAPGVRIGPMLGRENVKTRLESGEGMSFAEFTYPLMQAYDWWHLYQQQGVQVQIGGSDQYGNILSGVEAIKYMNKTHHDPCIRRQVSDPLVDPVGFTVPLLTTPSGEKFGKSAGNAVWLSKDATSTFDLYQGSKPSFFVRQPDADVERFLKMFTFMPIPDITALMAQHNQDPSKRLAQHRLAHEFVEFVHGISDANETAAQHRLAFSGKLPLLQSKKTSTPADQDGHATPTTMPSHHVTLPLSLITKQPMTRILVAAGLASSRSEAHRLIFANSVRIGSRADRRMMSEDLSFSPVENWVAEKNAKYIIDGSLMILRVGKWKLKLIKIVPDKEFWEKGLKIPEPTPGSSLSSSSSSSSPSSLSPSSEHSTPTTTTTTTTQSSSSTEDETGDEEDEQIDDNLSLAEQKRLRHASQQWPRQLRQIAKAQRLGVLGPGMLQKHMKARLQFLGKDKKLQLEGREDKRRKSKGKLPLEEEEEEEEEDDDDDGGGHDDDDDTIRRKEREFWKNVDL